MAKIKVKVDLRGLKSLTGRQIMSKKFQKRLGNETVAAIKSTIAMGKSPVKGQGRYEAYKVDRATAPLRRTLRESSSKDRRSQLRRSIKKTTNKSQLYPNSVKNKFPQKQKRPVNLELSGEMLKAFKWKGTVKGIRVGLINASQRIKKIFEAHNEGTNTDKQVPRRAIIPTKSGDRFTAGIQRKINNLIQKRIKDLLKAINKK